MNELRAPPAAKVRTASGLVLGLLAIALLPAIAVEGTILVMDATARRCPAPVVLRDSIAPERALVRLDMPEDWP